MQQPGGPAATSGPAQLALTNHDKESFNFGVMAEPSVLPQRTEFQRERWHLRTTIWRTRARPRWGRYLDSINDWVCNLGHVPLGGQTHDRYNLDMSIAPHGDPHDDGGC